MRTDKFTFFDIFLLIGGLIWVLSTDNSETIWTISISLVLGFIAKTYLVYKANNKNSANLKRKEIKKSEINSNVVFSNKELRARLEELYINNDNSILLEVKLNLKKWASIESDVNVTGLEYKGYKYELIGYIQEKRNDAELVDEIKTLDDFFELIGDKEIDVLDNDFDFFINGESDYHYIDKVNWIDEIPPEKIITEFESEFKKGEYHQYDQLIDQGEIEYLGESQLLNEFNNILQIELKLKVQDIEYDILWNNDKV